MITGDHKTTATAVAKEIGLFQEGNKALSGEELDKLSDEEINKIKQLYDSITAELNEEIKTELKNFSVQKNKLKQDYKQLQLAYRQAKEAPGKDLDKINQTQLS